MSQATEPSDRSGDASEHRDVDAGPEHESSRPEAPRQSLQDRYHDVEESYEDVRDRLETYNRRAVDFIRDNPGLCIAGALGAGYLLGRLASRRWLT